MSRLNPAAVMKSFTKKVTASISKWRNRKRSEVIEEHYDSMHLESLEQRVMLDGDNPGEEDFQATQEEAWLGLPADAAVAVVDYLNSEAVNGSSKIWRPLEEIRQADPDPATGQVSQDQIDELDLNRLVGEDSRTTFDNTYFDTYSIDQNLWTGLDITTEVKSFAQNDGSYIVVLKRTERDRSFDLGSSGGGAPGGPGSPGGGGSNPYEQVDSDILTTIVQTDDASVVSQIETNQIIDVSAFNRWLTIETDFTFRYEILSDDGFGQREFSVTTDYEIDLDVHWMGLYEHTVVDEAGDGTSGDSVDQLPLGETDITINYNLIVDADYEGNQSYEATAQLGPGNIGSATFENNGLASGTYSVVSQTTSNSLYTRGDLDYDAGQFGIRVELDTIDDLSLSSTSSFSYVGNGINTHGSTNASLTSGQFDFVTSRTTTINDQSETEFFYESFLDESASSEADAQDEANEAASEDTGEDTSDTGSDESTVRYYIPTTTHTHIKEYWKEIPANVGSSQSSSTLTVNYANGEQGLTHLTTDDSSSFDTTGDFYQSSSYFSVFSKDASSASFLSTSDSLLSSDQWIGTTSSESDLTFTPNADGEFVVTGFMDNQSSYTSGLVSNTIGTALIVGSVSAALRSDEEEGTDAGASDPGSGSSSSDESAPLPTSAENYLKNHLVEGFSGAGSTNPELHDDLSISYSYTKNSDSASSNTQYSPGHNNLRTEFENDGLMRLISSDSESYQVLSQGGTSSSITDSIVSEGDYTDENGSFYRDHSSTSSNWHVDDETVTSTSNLTNVLDAIEIETPDGTTGGSDTTGSGSSDPNAGATGGTTEGESSTNNYKTDVTTKGTTLFEQNNTGEYSYSETETSNQLIVNQKDEQESGDWTHLEVNDSFSRTDDTTSEGDSWSKYEVQYFGDVDGGIPIEGRSQSIWDRSQVISSSVTTDSSENDSSNSYRYRTHTGGQSLGEGTDLPGGSGTVQSATETSDVGESYSARLTSGTTTNIEVDEDLYTLTHRLLEDSGSSGTGGPGGGTPGSGDPSSGPALIAGPTFTYKTTYSDVDEIEVTLGGYSDVTVTTNYWDNLGDIQSQLSLGDTYADGQGNLGNDLVFQTGIAPDGTLIVGPDAPNVSTTSSSNVVHKVYFDSDGRYDVLDGTETFSKTTKNKRTLNKDDSDSNSTEDLPNSTRVTSYEILDNNAETSTTTVTHTNTYEDFGTRTQIVEKLHAANSGTETGDSSNSEDSSEEESTSLDPNDWLSLNYGIEANKYGTGSHTAETRSHGESNSSIKTRETVVDTEKDNSGAATRINTRTYTYDRTFDQTDTIEKTFDSNGYLEIKVTQDAVAGNNRIEKHNLTEDEFTANYTKTESDGGILETTRTGNSSSTSDEEFERSVAGSLTYNISYDGTPQDVIGSIVTTVTGTGDSDADDTQTVEKTKTYTGTFSAGDLDPGIVIGHVPQSIKGGGTETGTIEYTIKRTEIQELADNFSGTMTSTLTGSINSDGEFDHDTTNSYVNAVDGTKKTRTIAENNYQAFGLLGGTPTIDTGLVLADSYNITILASSFDDHKFLGYLKYNGFNAFNFVGTPIDADIGSTFASIPEADDSYASVTSDGTTTVNYQGEENSETVSEENGGSNYYFVTTKGPQERTKRDLLGPSTEEKKKAAKKPRKKVKKTVRVGVPAWAHPIGAPKGYVVKSKYPSPVARIVAKFLDTYSVEEIKLLAAFLEAKGKIKQDDIDTYFDNVQTKYKYAWYRKEGETDQIAIDDGVTDEAEAAALLLYALKELNGGMFRASSGLADKLDDDFHNGLFVDLNATFDNLAEKPLAPFLSFRYTTPDGIVNLADNAVFVASLGPLGTPILVYEAVSGETATVLGKPVQLSGSERVFRFVLANGSVVLGVVGKVAGKPTIRLIAGTAQKLDDAGIARFARVAIGKARVKAFKALNKLKNKIRAKFGLAEFAANKLRLTNTILTRKEIFNAFEGLKHTGASQQIFDDILSGRIKIVFKKNLKTAGSSIRMKIYVNSRMSMEDILTIIVHEGRHHLDKLDGTIPMENPGGMVTLFAELRAWLEAARFAKANGFQSTDAFRLADQHIFVVIDSIAEAYIKQIGRVPTNKELLELIDKLGDF